MSFRCFMLVHCWSCVRPSVLKHCFLCPFQVFISNQAFRKGIKKTKKKDTGIPFTYSLNSSSFTKTFPHYYMTQKVQLHVCPMSFFPILISRPKMADPLMSSGIPDQNYFTGQYQWYFCTMSKWSPPEVELSSTSICLFLEES